MFITKLIPLFLKQIIKIVVVKYKYNVKIGRNCILDLNTFFEGKNSIQKNATIGKSYIGKGSYIANDSIIIRTKIGRFCAIGGNVRTCLGKHPTKDFVSIHPAFFSTNKQTTGFSFTNKQLFDEHTFIDKDKRYVVEIGNDVWIGNNVMIMDGITIGDGAVVAAGAIVTKSVEPYSIVGGVPAKKIKMRFTEKQIERLIEIKWWNWKMDKLRKNADLFSNIDAFLKKKLVENQKMDAK